MKIAERIIQVSDQLQQYCDQSNRQRQQVRLLAVSKTHPASAIQAAYEAGITEFGESYLQEAVSKIAALKQLPISWHFIGPIQSNKTRPIAAHFDWVQSVDREKILTRLDSQRPTDMPPLNICIQANLFDEPQKKGALAQQLPELLQLANRLPNVTLRGLMVLPPRSDDYQQQLTQFKLVADIFSQLQGDYPQMDTLSMGMSSDAQAAIACGSNMVRIGTAIFGPRGDNHL